VQNGLPKHVKCSFFSSDRGLQRPPPNPQLVGLLRALAGAARHRRASREAISLILTPITWQVCR